MQMTSFFIVKDAEHDLYPLLAIIEHDSDVMPTSIEALMQKAYSDGINVHGDGIFEHVSAIVMRETGATVTYVEITGNVDFSGASWGH